MDGKMIGEVAKEFGLRPGTLRYWEGLRILPSPKRSAGGYRLYDGGARQRLAFIGNAKSLGLTLKEIRQIIAARNSGRFPCDSVRTTLAAHVRSIDQQIAKLQALKTDLQTILRVHRKRPSGRAAKQHAVCPMLESLPRRFTNGGGTR